MEVSENSKVTLDLKTIGMIIGFVISLSSMYFVLKSDIALAMTLPKPEVSKTEYELKDKKELRCNINRYLYYLYQIMNLRDL